MSVTIVWLRHGEKLFANAHSVDNLPNHDPPLIDGEEERIKIVGRVMIRKYGLPNAIITSPYRRARDTSIYLATTIEEKNRPKISVDSNISEYLGYQYPRKINGILTDLPEIEEKTASFKPPPLGESVESLRSRIVEHLKLFDLAQDVKIEKPIVVWVITHGIVISNIVRQILFRRNIVKTHYFNDTMPWGKSRNPRPLEGLSLIVLPQSQTVTIQRTFNYFVKEDMASKNEFVVNETIGEDSATPETMVLTRVA